MSNRVLPLAAAGALLLCGAAALGEPMIGGASTVVLDRFVYDPDAGTGEAAISFSKGIFRFVTGGIKNKEAVQLHTHMRRQSAANAFTLTHHIAAQSCDRTAIRAVGVVTLRQVLGDEIP